MTSENMIHMANQIALYFAAYPHEEAVTGIAKHLHDFWGKKMRNQLHTYVDGGGAGLHALVVEAEKRMDRPTAHAVHTAASLDDGMED